MKLKKLAALLLALTLTVLTLASCGNKSKPCKYATERDIEGRDITYVEMSIKKYGKIVILLDATTAPLTVENFLKLVNEDFYTDLTFHRIIKDFMIQGGDPKGNGSGGSADTIIGEFSSNGYANDISHIRGVISMARSKDNNSASSQFFICNADAVESLDGNYAAFGYVVSGMDVVDKITEKVFPKTALADLYGDMTYNSYYGTYNHYIWSSYGNGTVEKTEDKPVIEYIKVLEGYSHKK